MSSDTSQSHFLSKVFETKYYNLYLGVNLGDKVIGLCSLAIAPIAGVFNLKPRHPHNVFLDVIKMEVDTESTNTSVEDKTEDFCDNPTRDALTEGLMRLLKPTVDQLDEKVRTIRISQVELKQQIESLSEELKRINEANSDKDLDVYVKKLVNVKHKLTVVSNILQNSEERLLKLQQNITKGSNSQKALLETSNAKQVSVSGPDDSSVS